MSDNCDCTMACLARAYKKSCEDVQDAWEELISCPVRGYEDFKKRLAGRYTEARNRAMEARRALIEHASGGVMEVGM